MWACPLPFFQVSCKVCSLLIGGCMERRRSRSKGVVHRKVVRAVEEMNAERSKVFAAIDLAVRVSQYMRSRDLIPDMLEYQLRGFLDERKHSPDIPPNYMFLLGHVKSLCDNYSGLRRRLTHDDEMLLRDVTAIKAPRIEDTVAWDEINAMHCDAMSDRCPPAVGGHIR